MKRIVRSGGLLAAILAAAILAGCGAGKQASPEMPAPPEVAGPPEVATPADVAAPPGEAAIVRAYSERIYERLSAQKRYPDHEGREAKVMLTVRISRDGYVLARWAEAPLLFDTFAREAEAMVDRAGPFPAVPAEIEGETFEFLVPIDFRLLEEDD
jgi:protein TonB